MLLKLAGLMKIKNIFLKRFLTAPGAVNIMNPEQEAGSGSLFSDQSLCLASQLLPQVEQPVPVLAIQQVPPILELPPRIFSTAFIKERVVGVSIKYVPPRHQ